MDATNADISKRTLLRTEEAARCFGVTARTIRNWLDEGYLESVRVSGTLRVKCYSVLFLLDKKKDD